MQTSTVHGINLIFPRGNLKKKKKKKKAKKTLLWKAKFLEYISEKAIAICFSIN